MKGLILVAFLAVAGVAVWAADTYTDEFDGVDVKEILNNKRLFDNYYGCLKTGDKCTAAGRKLKELIPDALQNGCAKCTEIQKKNEDIVIRDLVKNHPDKFLELEKLYDSERKYRSKYAKELAAEGITLPE